MADDVKKYKIKCGSCGAGITFKETLLGRTKPCPKCGEMISFNLEDAVPAAPVTAAGGDGGSVNETGLTQRMKANKAIAGQACSSCGREIDLGDDIYNCPACDSAMHYECYAQQGGCGNAGCSQYHSIAQSDSSSALVPADAADEYAGQDTKECPQCGEVILAKAKKCKYCKSIIDRNMQLRIERNKVDTDDKLSALEIVFGVLCGGIACIVGIVWGCMGKKKGWKLVVVSLISQVVWTLIQLALANVD